MDVDMWSHQVVPTQRLRGATWREALARKQSRLLAEFLRRNSASKLQADAPQETPLLQDSETTLSHDLLYQIFMLLPADSLFRLQFVCKQWFGLINSPAFVASHAQESETVLIAQQLSLSRDKGCVGKPKSYFHFLSLDSCLGSSFAESSVPDLASVRASCHGLILASNGRRKRLILMNPMTGKHVDLPLGVASHHLCESFGIAFSSEAKTYKVVHLFREVLGGIGCEMLSLNARIWMRIEGPLELLQVRQIPVSAGGSLHWLASKRGRDSFVSMNVDDEKFVSKRLPVKRAGSDRLVEMGGNLGFVTREVVSTLQVWILIGGEYWMRRCSINLSGAFVHCVPICSRRNQEEMVIECVGSRLYVYNFDRDEMRVVSSGSGDGDGDGHGDEPWFGKINGLYIPHRNTLVSCADQNMSRIS